MDVLFRTKRDSSCHWSVVSASINKSHSSDYGFIRCDLPSKYRTQWQGLNPESLTRRWSHSVAPRGLPTPCRVSRPNTRQGCDGRLKSVMICDPPLEPPSSNPNREADTRSRMNDDLKRSREAVIKQHPFRMTPKQDCHVGWHNPLSQRINLLITPKRYYKERRGKLLQNQQ